MVQLFLRLICTVAVIGAAAVIAADYHAHTQAWLAYWHSMGLERPDYAVREIKAAAVAAAPWLVTAAIQGFTIRRQSVALDNARGFSLLLACISMSAWWPEMQFWRAMGNGPFGDWAQGDFDGGLDIFLSFPVCFFTVLAVVVHLIYSRAFSAELALIK